MRNRKIMSALCIMALFGNSLAALAQDQTAKKKEQKQNVFIFRSDDGKTVEVPHVESWVSQHVDGPDVLMAPFGNGFSFASGQEGAPTVEFISHEFSFDSKVAKNAPYSADAINETVQTLGDGNRIVRRSSSRVYRDSEGRTRHEQELKAVGPWTVAGEPQRMIFINDPVTETHYSLNPQKKTAHKMTVSRFVGENGGTASVRVGGINRTANATVAGKGDVRFVTSDNQTIVLSGTGSDEKVMAEVKARIAAESGAQTASGGAIRMAGPPRMVKAINSDRVKREELGKQIMEGVEVEGTRTTITIPAGEIDNELPIAIVSERWYSPELQVVVMSKNSDPRTGVSTYRLTNINRAEPDASLFQAPADYTLEESGTFDFKLKALKEKMDTEMKAREKRRQEN